MGTVKDIVRQIVVVASMAFALVGSAFGSGAFSDRSIQTASSGALSASFTPVAPAGPAFSIWGVVYLGLLAATVWQALPAQRADARQRRVGYPVAVTLVLNAAWILTAQAGLLALSGVVIAALLATLVWTFLALLATRPRNAVEAVVLDGTMGLYLGWVSVATVANVAAILTAAGVRPGEAGRDATAVVVLLVVGALGALLAVRDGGRLAPTAAIAWGLAWIAVGRLTGELMSTPAAVAALVAAALAVVVTLVVRARVGWTGRVAPREAAAR
ncbi:TspO/MBR family protein [Clavibacter zhangzhiyongii]|uniref:Tryptophan-rich sensory protein n=1 Tax=Clavibacter zhangzhiyongii TaxID=2768071 RepID=A0A7L7Z435_9MICO|nr:TspO/MBR family protein [Clavibacter zhangzhiyongii]QOD44476.1 tryptophan-rich sensory protein [Clavibacter zhangzhiyongii]